jgi:hypothetical protein
MTDEFELSTLTIDDAYMVRVLAARLKSEGIFCELRQNGLATYTAAIMNGYVQVMVPTKQLDHARQLLPPPDEPDSAEVVRIRARSRHSARVYAMFVGGVSAVTFVLAYFAK